ncbi:DUF4249 family protein [Luteibaculum oceani]|uniref:DUF4249 family protein n=1 Tax=Luteibaculum oceani TaxID=1294296 RepID=A0A5C6VCQ9_9FLAO|nr:DUF4249 family protein [Luteibaculum oceani]TXC81325.1 DUF4249 family protein [Luteibaculum oceani]
MDKNILKLLCAITVLIASSCEKIIEIKADPIPPVLVINGMIQTSDSCLIHVFSTDSSYNEFRDWRPIDIKGANVFLENQSGEREQLQYTKQWGGYIGKPRNPGDQLKLIVSHTNYPTVYAETLVPRNPSSFNATNTITYEEEGSSFKEYRVDFDWTYNSRPRYILGEVQQKIKQRKGTWPLYDTITTYHNENLHTYDARVFAIVDPIEDLDGTRYLGNQAYIENVGNQDRVKISLYWDEYSSGEAEQEMYATISILSEEAYRFFTQAILQDYTKYNPFASAVNVQGNIENGYGIFYAVNKSRVKL